MAHPYSRRLHPVTQAPLLIDVSWRKTGVTLTDVLGHNGSRLYQNRRSSTNGRTELDGCEEINKSRTYNTFSLIFALNRRPFVRHCCCAVFLLRHTDTSGSRPNADGQISHHKSGRYNICGKSTSCSQVGPCGQSNKLVITITPRLYLRFSKWPLTTLV